MTNLGTLKSIPLRDVWKNEASEFTPWLSDNIGALGEAGGLELEFERREAPVGDFSLDILATEVGTNRRVVIENQFGATDHDHLGKLLTYAAGYDADVVIWITEALRDEHRQAMEWLNRRTGSETGFFGVVVQVLQIDDSRLAYQFEVVVRPSEWRKSTIASVQAVSGRQLKYKEYFQRVIDKLREEHSFTRARIAGPQNWISFSSGVTGIWPGASFAQGKRARVEVYIDRSNYDENKRIFDTLKNRAKELEAAFGAPLAWERLEDRRASRVATYRPGSIDDTSKDLAQIEAWMIERLLAIKAIMVPAADEASRT